MEDEAGDLNLRWDDHTLTFVHLLDHFRIQELYCDASLACAGGGVYPVHKVVLSACSEFFASIFASSTCQNPVVVLQDVAPEHLEALLTYIYRGQVLLARPHLPSFLKVAESLQVKGLAPPPLIPLPCDSWGTSTRPSHTHPPPPPPYSSPEPTLPPYPRQEMPNPPQLRGGVPYEGEGVQRRVAPLQTPSKTRGNSHGEGNSHRPPRKRFSPYFGNTEHFGGTFQNLVASEEEGIKEEPVEEEHPDYFDADRLTIYEREEEEEEEMEMEEETTIKQEEQDEKQTKEGEENVEEKQKGSEQAAQEMTEGGERKDEGDGRRREEGEQEERGGRNEDVMDVKIMLDTREHPDIFLTNTTTGVIQSSSPSFLPIHSPTLTPSPSPTAAHHARSPSQTHALSPTPGYPAHSPVPTTPSNNTSHLRRELLKPLQDRVAPLTQHSIPHSVIAMPREVTLAGTAEEAPREPPPLVKITAVSSSSAVQYHQHHHHQQQYHHHQYSRQSKSRDDTTSTSTITTTSTTPTTILPSKSHHLLVTTQPTYRARFPPTPKAVPPTTTQYLPTLALYKNTHMDTEAPLNLSQDTHHAHHALSRHRTPGAPRVEQSKQTRDGDPFLGKILTNRKRRLRGPKSWEYLVRLLRDPTTNPSLIKWENEARGVFRLVQPAVIAQRWGRRTGKHASECLSYENFARGLRYHYATGALEPVSERSFVYKFGPKAHMALGGDGECVVPTGAEVTGGGVTQL